MSFNWKWWVLVVILIMVLVLIINMKKKCKMEGDKLGVPYRCKIFSTEPITIIAERHYYGKRDGKCYEFLNYGNNMSVKEVALANCLNEEEIKDKVDKGEFAEVIYG